MKSEMEPRGQQLRHLLLAHHNKDLISRHDPPLPDIANKWEGCSLHSPYRDKPFNSSRDLELGVCIRAARALAPRAHGRTNFRADQILGRVGT